MPNCLDIGGWDGKRDTMSTAEDLFLAEEQGSGNEVSNSSSQLGDEADVPQFEDQEMQDYNPSTHEGGTPMTQMTQMKRSSLQDSIDDFSEVSSVDASLVDGLPKRAGSPIDSIASGAADPLSAQVWNAVATRLNLC